MRKSRFSEEQTVAVPREADKTSGAKVTSPRNSVLFKTRGTVAFWQARRDARRSNEEVEIFRGADRLRTAVG